jgi:replicative DNA helicase
MSSTAIKQDSKSKELQNLKQPPYSIEAERSVLGALIMDNEAYHQINILINEHDFFLKEHQFLFKVISKLATKDQNFDALFLIEYIKRHELTAPVDGQLIFEIVNQTPSSSNIKSYAEIVRELATARKLIQTGQQISTMGFQPEGEESSSLLNRAEQLIFGISDQQKRQLGPIELNEILSEATKKIQHLCENKNSITGLETGFTDLDKLTTGLQNSDLIVIAGRPSMGKTALAINIAEFAALNSDKPIVIFSMEMPSDAIAMRMLCSIGRINQTQLRSGQLSDQDWPRLTDAISKLSQTKIFIDDTAALSPNDIKSRVRRLARKHGDIGLVVIDYIQLMHIPGKRENRAVEISEISRMLKEFSKEIKAPVIACSQLNRSLEQRQDKRPIMSDLRESGAIEQDADIIAFIYRDEVYHEQSPDKGIAEIIIGKHRNGPTGRVKLTFFGQYSRFENYSAEGYIVAT